MKPDFDDDVLDAIQLLREADEALSRVCATLQARELLGSSIGLQVRRSAKRHRRLTEAMVPELQRAQTFVQRRSGLERLGAEKRRYKVPHRTGANAFPNLSPIPPKKS